MEQSDLDYIVDLLMYAYGEIFIANIQDEHTSRAFAEDVFQLLRDDLSTVYRDMLVENFNEDDFAEIANYQRKYAHKMISLGENVKLTLDSKLKSSDFASKLELVYERHNMK